MNRATPSARSKGPARGHPRRIVLSRGDVASRRAASVPRGSPCAAVVHAWQAGLRWSRFQQRLLRLPAAGFGVRHRWGWSVSDTHPPRISEMPAQPPPGRRARAGRCDGLGEDPAAQNGPLDRGSGPLSARPPVERTILRKRSPMVDRRRGRAPRRAWLRRTIPWTAASAPDTRARRLRGPPCAERPLNADACPRGCFAGPGCAEPSLQPRIGALSDGSRCRADPPAQSHARLGRPPRSRGPGSSEPGPRVVRARCQPR